VAVRDPDVGIARVVDRRVVERGHVRGGTLGHDAATLQLAERVGVVPAPLARGSSWGWGAPGGILSLAVGGRLAAPLLEFSVAAWEASCVVRRRSAAAAGVALSIAVAVPALAISSHAAQTKCGMERWAVKTLTDPGAANVDLAHFTSKRVEDLRRLTVPKTWTITSPRIPPIETTSYRVNALLMSMIREDDSDIHLVIADPRVGGSMIVEFPADTCTAGASAQARTLMKQARDAITAACGGEPGNSVVTLRGRAFITGIAFFDRVHQQGGVAPNGIELHPVTNFQSSSCERVTP
jgi:hypothetical protein